MGEKSITAEKLTELDRVLAGCRTLLIMIHDYPDPDAIASAFAFAHLLHQRYNIRTRIGYGGLITRAENRAMVQQLKITMTHTSKLRWKRHRSIALLDTQPSFGNHSLPSDVKPIIVIDHHEVTDPVEAPFVDIRMGYGACATVIFEYLAAAEIDIPAPVATAIAFAIRTETQELGRDARDEDLQAYLQVYPKANKRKIAKIANPKLPHSYFLTLKTALSEARTFRHLAHVHLGRVESPEIISQVADLLLRHFGIGWSLATGRFNQQLYLSLRASHPKAHAGNVLKKIIGHFGTGGGHGTMAGGRIPFNGDNPQQWHRLEHLVNQRYLRALGYKKDSAWKRLIE
ncbi:MAG: DHH family phosphoesterase [candidate division KSB1 bacterium]|nr:DHH family phosphoesterase [candidate division KSB1 bacterium]MDQ7065131.1 DHH family phosphoesterase [candidate division KSB1 bacterium]